MVVIPVEKLIDLIKQKDSCPTGSVIDSSDKFIKMLRLKLVR
jgi:hypothetical protein